MGALTTKELLEFKRHKAIIGSSIKQTRCINTIHKERTIDHVVVSLGLARIDVERSGACGLLLLLGLLFHNPVRAHVRKVVGITTCEADSSVDCGCLSRLMALRGWEQSLMSSGGSCGVAGTSTAVGSKMTVHIAVGTETTGKTHRVMIRACRVSHPQNPHAEYHRLEA
ncbi:hypothetical protein HanOQP8_Chr04g0132241 [Helianthus annuus]|nr:hypothetical protein HanOQP8_Chr04g0132241 [Helianthus annuus]